MEKTVYVAEDVPAYMFDDKCERPWRDEDVAMSAAKTLAKDQEYKAALQVMMDHLMNISTFNISRQSGESATWVLAATFFGSFMARRYPADVSVQISGRVYRVREQ